MKRKKVITIEIQRDVVVKKLERKIHISCPTCGTDVEVTIPSEILEEQSEDVLKQIVNMVKESALHANHSDESQVDSEQILLPPASEPSKV